MSRGLSKEQKKLIRNNVQDNIQRKDNPYEISSDTHHKCRELNDHETFSQNVDYYLNELKEEEYKKTYMSKEFGHYLIDKGN